MRYKTGRLAAKHPVGLRWIDDYMGLDSPSAPPWVTYPHHLAWGMLGNDQYGDCTMAGMAHTFMANAAVYNQVVPEFTTSEVTQTYFQLSGGADSGLAESDVLSYAQTSGLWGNKIAGYAPVNVKNMDLLRVVISEFRAAYLGVVIPYIAQTQFQDQQPWDLTNGPADRQIDGGHCVTAVGYNAEYVFVVTWGAIQKVTWRWLDAYLEETWAVLTPEDAQVDLVALQKDLRVIQTY